MTRRLASDTGSSIVTALFLTLLLLSAGMAVIATVDTQQSQVRGQRERESSFQLAESVLNSEIYRLSQRWPGSTGTPYQPECLPATGGNDCPNNATLAQFFKTADYGSGLNAATWKTHVRDNGGANPSYYSEDLLATQPSRDANNDDRLWVRSEAKVRGRTRVLVALIKAEVLPSPITQNKTLVAGSFASGNNGAKTIINNGPEGDIVVRCGTGGAMPAPVNGCAGYEVKNNGTSQIAPASRVTSSPNYAPAMTPEQLDLVRAQAATQGNYYEFCGAGGANSMAGDVPGEIVFVEDGTNCKFTGNATYNEGPSPANPQGRPGAFVMAKGGPLEMRGNIDFFGVIYHANTENVAAGTLLVDLSGNGAVIGGVVVDGLGAVKVGASGRKTTLDGGNLQHSPNAGRALTLFGTAGIVQNSFRELNASK